jgi:hypothetical protein
VFSEVEEMELAAELLSVSNEQELDQFLGKIFKGVKKAVGGLVKSPVGKALGGILKTAAKKALPIAGGALGTFVGGPAGGALGSKLASMAGKAFGLELEGLSPEDQEFEIARRYVRLAGAAARNAASYRNYGPPGVLARRAFYSAARRHAPGLLRRNYASGPSYGGYAGHGSYGGYSGGYGGYGQGGSGRWVRRGRKIILYGL